VGLSCAAVPATLLESELFGHEKGAFTGATATKRGYLEAADGGTLFLDEIGELSPEVQVKLLRVLETRRVQRVGGREEIAVDVRVICATHRDLEAMVQQGQFRQDLYYRIAGFVLEIPPLRERPADIPELVDRFLADFSEQTGMPRPEIAEPAMAKLTQHGWPGNVRELRNAVARRLALGDLAPAPKSSETEDHTSAVHRVAPGGDPIGAVLALDLPLADARQRVVDELEQRYVERLLDQHDGNMARAAAAAGVARRHFRRLKAKVQSKDEPG
jgi:DNA-binding NtrC family response regulator